MTRRRRLRRDRCATSLPRQFPGTTFCLPARRHRHADPQFRPAGADRRAGDRQQPRRPTAPMPTNAAEAHPHGRRASPIARIQQAFNDPTLNVDVDRSLAAEVGLTEARCRQQPAGHARRQHPDRADLLAQSEERRVLSDRRADAAILDRHHRRPVRTCRSPRDGATQLLGGLATDQARTEHRASCRTTTCSRSSISIADNARPRPRRASPPTFEQILNDTAKQAAARLDRRAARPGHDDDQCLQPALRRPRAARSC